MSKEPIRVAHIVGKYVGGGVEAVVMNYYKHIDKSKVQFDFFFDEDSLNIPYEIIESLGGRIYLIPPYQKIFNYQRELKKILVKNNYKIIHSHINTLSIFPLRIAKKVKIPVRIAHSHSTTNKKEWKKNLVKQILRPFSKLYATNFMCCSELAGRWLFGNTVYDKGKVYLLNNAIELDKFKYDEQIRKKVRSKLNIKEDTLVIGHIGRFVPQKNHDFLIDIFKDLHDKNDNSVLLLVGQGPLTAKIEEKVKKLNLENAVMFLGQRNDVNELYQAFDVFCLPSLYEGLAVVAVEAQASGLLCILSDDMTFETKVLDTTIFLSLNETATFWSSVICEKQKNYMRANTEKQLLKRGFDINVETSKLVLKYIEMLEACNYE